MLCLWLHMLCSLQSTANVQEVMSQVAMESVGEKPEGSPNVCPKDPLCTEQLGGPCVLIRDHGGLGFLAQ